MHQMALYFLLLFTPLSVDAPAVDLHCPEARQIAEMRPCLRPEDCGAYQQWQQTFGPPGAVPLEPRSAAVVRPPAVPHWCLVERTEALPDRR